MIEVRLDNLVTADVECVLRSVSSDLEPLTALGRSIGEAAGPDLLERMGRMGDMPVGGAVITPGGELRAAFMVHVVVQSAEERVTSGGVRTALLNGLRRASQLGVETLALPLLGTGAGNLDAEAAANAMVPVIREHLDEEEYPKEVIVMVANEYERDTFEARLGVSDEKKVEKVNGDGVEV